MCEGVKVKIEIRWVHVYARSCLSILVYWLVIKLRSCFWKHGESYDKTPDFVWKILSFFSKPDCFFGLLFRKKSGRCVSWEKRVPLRVEAGKREKRGLSANRRTVGRRPDSFATADRGTKAPDSRSAETKPHDPFSLRPGRECTQFFLAWKSSSFCHGEKGCKQIIFPNFALITHNDFCWKII